MNHIPYHLSLIRRDELLREASDHRRANEAAAAAEASSSILRAVSRQTFDRFASTVRRVTAET